VINDGVNFKGGGDKTATDEFAFYGEEEEEEKILWRVF
jgi:hypothetical protein